MASFLIPEYAETARLILRPFRKEREKPKLKPRSSSQTKYDQSPNRLDDELIKLLTNACGRGAPV